MNKGSATIPNKPTFLSRETETRSGHEVGTSEGRLYGAFYNLHETPLRSGREIDVSGSELC